MKKLLLAIAAVGTVGAALPAMADPYDHGGGYGRGGYSDYRDHGGYRSDYGYGGGREIGQRTREISFRIDRGVRDGSLDWREARGLRARLDDIQRLGYRYGRDGLDGRERAELNARLDRLSFQVRGARHDGDRRW